MNKKSQSEIITTVLIILLVLAAIIIVWNVVSETTKPKFNITLTECHNEFNEVNTRINIACTLGCMYKWTNYTFDCMDYCHTLLNETEKACENKSVDEIIINNTYKNCISWKDRKDVSDYDYLHYGIPCIELEYIENITHIKKSEITGDWLIKNCECLNKKYSCPYFFYYKIFNYTSFGKDNFVCYSPQMVSCLTQYQVGICSGHAEEPKEKCYQYQCGNYTLTII